MIFEEKFQCDGEGLITVEFKRKQKMKNLYNRPKNFSAKL